MRSIDNSVSENAILRDLHSKNRILTTPGLSIERICHESAENASQERQWLNLSFFSAILHDFKWENELRHHFKTENVIFYLFHTIRLNTSLAWLETRSSQRIIGIQCQSVNPVGVACHITAHDTILGTPHFDGSVLEENFQILAENWWEMRVLDDFESKPRFPVIFNQKLRF